MTLLPFDLEKALAGAKVVTRDGRAVTQLVLFTCVDTDYPLWGAVNSEGEGRIRSWTERGWDSSSGLNSVFDLFMVASEPKPAKKVVYWTNFYANGQSRGYPDRAIADGEAKHYRFRRIGGKARRVVLEVAE